MLKQNNIIEVDRKNISNKKSLLPLCVDLDGTLVKTDLLLESLIGLLKNNVAYIFILPIWILKGKAYFKRQIANRVGLTVETLPYHSTFLDFLRNEYRKGRPLYLATASDITYGQNVKTYLSIFLEVFGSDGRINLKGIQKAQFLVEKFGEKKFEYAGNSKADIPVWEKAERAIIVDGYPKLNYMVKTLKGEVILFSERKRTVGSFLKSLRIHQWTKNLLIFLPMVFAHRLADVTVLTKSALAFLSFCFIASGQYLINDLLDLEADRQHPTKNQRPFASGDLPLLIGFIAAPGLIVASIAVAMALPQVFLLVLLLYFVVSTLYSFRLKRYIIIDFLVLAGLYTVRLMAGASAYSVPLSPWILAFSMFFFTSLACVKRFIEVRKLNILNIESTKGRGYISVDLQQISIMGMASGYLSVLVFALYINGREIHELYRKPFLLWLICPILLYWISRIWLLANRGDLHDDPIVFAIKDKRSYLMASIIAFILLLSTYL